MQPNTHTESIHKISDLFQGNSPLITVLPDLLADRTTGKNIVWATDTYESYNSECAADKPMQQDFVMEMLLNEQLVPRVQKPKAQKAARTKHKAEVFTPSWVCNEMINMIDHEWFGREGVFNTPGDNHTWTPTETPVQFGERQVEDLEEWQRYVRSTRLEITCGEAPFLVSRYDTVTGKALPIPQRIGMLDRKLRVVNENSGTKEAWLDWAFYAFESTYGYEYQGDNLFFARVNLMQTFLDYYIDRFGENPPTSAVLYIAYVVSWNIWQMDGLKDTVPYSSEDGGGDVYAKIMDWDNIHRVEFRSLKESKQHDIK